MTLRAFNKEELYKIESLLSLLEKYSIARSLAKNLRTSISTGCMAPNLKKSLANWCRLSNDNRGSARKIAIEISDTIFGKKHPIVQSTTSFSQLHYACTSFVPFNKEDLWKTELEHLKSIRAITSRNQCERILEFVKSLDKNLHIQYFSKKSCISFIVKGLKIAEIKPHPKDFDLKMITKIRNQGYESVRSEEKELLTVKENQPVSEADLRKHFVSEANKLIELRKNNTIGYREKWLHCLLIEKMQNGGLSGSDLEFLYYEAQAGKIMRKNGPKWMYIDILAKEKCSKALALVEVKVLRKKNDMNSVLFDRTDKILPKSLYVKWFVRYKEEIKQRISELGWDANIDKLKFFIAASDVDFKKCDLNRDFVENIKNLGCEVVALHLNDDWMKLEDVCVVKTRLLSA